VAQYINDSSVLIPGRTAQPDDTADRLNIDPDFTATMKIPVLLGRGLEQGDLASPNVALVNQAFAAKYFGGESPVGRQFQFNKNTNPFIQIVGVVKNAHYGSLQEDLQTIVYVPYNQGLAGLRNLFFEIRTAGDPMGTVAEVRRTVHEASRDVSITEVSTQADRMEQTISKQRTFADLGTCFAVLALLIACVGLYGAMAYTVARRTGEIGIRMALGAQRRKIIWMVLREVIALTAAGLLIGYVAARFTTYLVESFLYGVKGNDPLAMAAAAGILVAAALAAGYAPAWRASRIDPAVALRNE
jgi:predicted permease